jgi:regulatory protein YycI of two-component signal transduction system YycFG
MKKTIFLVCLMIFSLFATSAFASKSDSKRTVDNSVVPTKTENKLSEEEVSRLTRRVEEIRDMDKSNMTLTEKRELSNELKTIKEKAKKNHGYVYIGVGTLLLIILLIVLLV